MGEDYPTLLKVPKKKRFLLSKYDYVSLAEESDFYIVDMTADERESHYYENYHRVKPDALDLRWVKNTDGPNETRLSRKKSLTLKFHDGALAGTRVLLD